jgi:hypothetical protein
MTSVYSCSPRRRRVFIVVAAVSLASSILDHSSLCVGAYSFVSSRLRNNHFRQHGHQPSQHHTSSSSVRRSLLVMKRPKLSSTQIQLPVDESGELPANLKRLVRAARPTLGHVVPRIPKLVNTNRHLQRQQREGPTRHFYVHRDNRVMQDGTTIHQICVCWVGQSGDLNCNPLTCIYVR